MSILTVDDVYSALQIFKTYVQANFPFKATLTTGTADPTVSPGVAANVPSFYVRLDGSGNLLNLYIKSTAVDTGWTMVDTSVVGQSIIYGTGVPSNTVGLNGDSFISDNSTTTGYVTFYQKAASAWVQKVSMFNSPSALAVVFGTTVAPPSVTALPWLNINTTTKVVSQWNGTAWVTLGSLNGQTPIQFQNAGVNVGAAGAFSTVNFNGSGVTTTDATGGVLSVAITGGGGGGKTPATVNQTVNVATGTKSVAQAFADLDVFSYPNGFTGTINIPAAYVFTPTDVLALYGRKDCAGWLRIISAQFPTAHTCSGTFAANVLGAIQVLFGFIDSGCKDFQVSVDASALTGSALIPVFAMDSELFFVGDINTQTSAAFTKGPAAATDAYFINCNTYAMYAKGGQLSVQGCVGQAASIDITGTQTGNVGTVVGNSFPLQFTVHVGNGTYADIRDNSHNLSLDMVGGATYMGVRGQVYLSTASTVPVTVLGTNTYVMNAVGDLNLVLQNTVTWKPLTVNDGWCACSTDNGATLNLDFAKLARDTSVTAVHSNLFFLGTSRNVTANLIAPTAGWGANSEYDVAANAYTAQAGIIRDLDKLAVATDNGGTGTITPSADVRSLHVTNAATLATLTINHTNLPSNSECRVYFDSAVTALTISGATNIFNAPTTIAAKGSYRIAKTSTGDLVVG